MYVTPRTHGRPCGGLAIVLAEVGYGLEVRHQPARQPNQLDVALALPFQPTARLHPIEVAVDVNLQQRRRMVGRPSCRLRLNTAKAQAGQIKRIDKNIDRPDRVILGQIVIQPLGKQHTLTAVIANDKARHRILPSNHRRIVSLRRFHTAWVKRRHVRCASRSRHARERQLCAKSCPWQAKAPTFALLPKADSIWKS
jgi:hypothetical protein